MNKIILMGRLTRNPEIRVTPSNTKVADFTIAVNRKYKKQGEAEADFFNCTAFGKNADFVENYLKDVLPEDKFQFIRNGYYTVDKDSKGNDLIFNRIVGLKSSFNV